MTETAPDPTPPPAGQEPLGLVLNLVTEVNQGQSREHVFGLVADTLRQIFGIDRFALVLMQEGTLRLALNVGLSGEYVETVHDLMAEAAGARALDERRPMYIPDATSGPDFWPLQEAARKEGFFTVLILPLFAGSEPLGYLIMYHNAVRVYTPAEVMLAQALALQAAFAVQLSRMVAGAEAHRLDLELAFQQRVAEAEVIDDIMLRISSSLDLASTLQSITDAAAKLSDAKTACLYLRGDDHKYRALAAHGVPLDELQTLTLHPTEGIIGQISRTGLPVQVTNFGQEVSASAAAMSIVADVGIQATLGVPLLSRGECVGALYVARQETTPFSPEIVRTLSRLAAFAEVAVQNARRFTGVEERRSRLQAYVDAIPEGVIVYDRLGTIALVNETMKRELRLLTDIVGLSRSEVLSSTGRYSARPISFQYDTQAVFQRVITTGEPEEGLLTLEEPDQTFELHFSPLRSDSGHIEGVVGAMRDISIPLELERERSRTNLLNQLLDLSMILNSDLSVPVLTERVVEVAMELVGARAGTLGLIEGDRLVFRRFRQPQGWVDFDFKLKRGQGAPGHVWESEAPYVSNDSSFDPKVLHGLQQQLGFRRLVTVPVVNRSGKLLGTLGVYDPLVERDFGQRDVEALQLLAHQVAIAIDNARLNEVKDSFLSIVSHELKTPVTSIKGFTQVLQRRLPPEALEHAGRYLDVINQQTDRLTTLINDLLDLSRIQTGRFHFEMGTVDYVRLLSDVVTEMQLISPENRIALDVPNELSVHGNGNRLRQVLVNLIDNAIQHGPLKGTISLSIEADEDSVTTRVRDEGTGLPAGEEERIFDPYYQIQHGLQSAKGLGLGLYISRQVVEGHEGRIWLESDSHTTFCFTVPREG